MDKFTQVINEATGQLQNKAAGRKPKLERDAFLYMEPKEPKAKFAQCETCQMWTDSKRNRCAILGEQTLVKGDMSCGLYVHGKPDPTQDTSVVTTAEEVGLTNHQVRCENCSVFDAKTNTCKGFEALNQNLPDVFELNTKVNPHGCCNAWH